MFPAVGLAGRDPTGARVSLASCLPRVDRHGDDEGLDDGRNVGGHRGVERDLLRRLAGVVRPPHLRLVSSCQLLALLELTRLCAMCVARRAQIAACKSASNLSQLSIRVTHLFDRSLCAGRELNYGQQNEEVDMIPLSKFL